jgi:hypothetical protein
MNESTKPWYLSKGFLGPLVTAVLICLRNLGFVDLDADTTLGVIYQGAELVGAIFGIIGRLYASKKVTLLPQPAAPAAGSPPSLPSDRPGAAQETTPSAGLVGTDTV